MNPAMFVDVTQIEPRLKHPTIFESFDRLQSGETLVIHNDHDPKPLYYQLLGERGNCFSWNYLSNGPQVWEVAITRNAAQNETVGEIAAKDMRKAEVFKRMGIDFCCGGKKSLEEACAEKGLDTDTVKRELESAINTSAAQHDFASWKPSFLADYIVNVHHGYTLNNMPLIRDLSMRVAGHHGSTHPDLFNVRDKVDELVCELSAHLKKEEAVLFPYIKALEAKKADGISASFDSVRSPLNVMERDHELVGELLAEIRHFTNDYQVPQGACNSFSLLYKKLQEFESDLLTHIHLENNILFPKAIELEQAA